MKVIAINGSPRKKWNTATMLTHALQGAASQGAETKLVHLYDLDYKGCMSCFACKRKDGKNLGRCGTRDGLTPLLEEIREANALILGSPIYFGEVTGGNAFLLGETPFPILVYEKDSRSLFPRKIPTAWIYTMNIPESMVKDMRLERVFEFNKYILEMLIGPCESVISFDTLQFEDYSKYVSGMFDAEAKRKRHEEVFPQDCRKAYEMGARLVQMAATTAP